MLKIKKDDEVIVIAGRDKGKRGEVMKVLDGGKVVVSGVNLLKKNTRPNPSAGQPGGIIEREGAIDVSNVAIWNPVSEKADRVGIKVEDGRKTRVYKSSNEPIDK
jgi:large subunit ribosomal protein L24